MLFLLFLAGLAGVVAFASFVWLLVLAFREHVLWGLALLFLPFAPIVFAVKYWQAVKKPFLINLGSSMASVLLVFAAGGAALGAIARTAPEGFADASMTVVPPADMQDTTFPDAGVSELAAVAAGHPAPAPSRPEAAIPPVIEPSSPRVEIAATGIATRRVPPPLPGEGEIPVSRIDDRYVGRLVRVVAGDGLDTEARVTAVDAGTVSFERTFGSGTVGFELDRREIESIHLIER